MREETPVQILHQTGSDNIGVQIDGHNNTVTIFCGTARLTLAFRHRVQRAPTKDLDLLNPYRCPIELVGRAKDLESLQAWLQSDKVVAVQCRIGRAGSGKTRLAIELCRWAEAQGWTAGFLTHDELTRFQRDGHVRGWDWPSPTLIVVDYAATSAAALRHWLEDLADRDCTGRPPLRLLLLERHASTDLGWWSELTRFSGFSAAPIEDLLDPPEPVELSRVSDRNDRRTLLQAIMAEAAKLAGKPAPPLLPNPGTDPAFDTAIARDAVELEPLYLLMAGLTAVQTNVPHVLALTRTDLATRLAARELERISDLAAGHAVDPTLAQHLAAFLTLMNGCPTAALPDIVTTEAAILGHTLTTGPDPVAHLLADTFTSEQPDRLDPIRPDLIGEAAILAIFERHRRPPDWQAATVTRAYDRNAPETTATVIRTAQDYATGRLDHPSLLWLDCLADQAVDPFQQMAIADQLPQRTVNLRERAVAVWERITNAMRDASAGQPQLRALLATALNSLGNRLAELGWREAALAATEEAVAVYCELTAAQPDVHLPDLAMSSNNLGIRLSELGRHDDALAATEKAVEIYGKLAAARPDAFRPYLARSLNNLGGSLSALGQHKDALKTTEEAVEIYRELAAARPDTFRPFLAGSLDNLGLRLSELGRRKGALEAIEEAVEIYRALAAARPDAFQRFLAGSLNNLGAMLSELGRREAALAATEEALAVYRALAATRPDAFRPFLADSLNNLGAMLSQLGRREDALAATEEAVGIFRELAAAWPQAHLPKLSISLFNQAMFLEALDRLEEALASNAEAIDALRPTFLAQPMAVVQWMQPMCVQYLQRARKLGVEPAAALIGPIVEVFQTLQAQAQTEGDQP